MVPKALLHLLLTLAVVIGSPLRSCPGEYLLDPAVSSFRKYVQIDTSKEYNLRRAVEFWRKQALELGLPFRVYHPRGLPVCVITVIGRDPTLPAIIYNSHMDVVPAIEEEWRYHPFSAFMDENGDIYGRGTQDDKDIAIQYIEAVRRLRRNNITLDRTMHITLMPDEETGGFRGMKPFIKSAAFRAMNVGFVLDEGLASADDILLATDEDRRPWQLQVTVRGEGGHGFSMPEETAMEKAAKFISAVAAYRNEMKTLMLTAHPLDFGKYTSVNVNMINGGNRPNIIPTELVIVVDIRLASASNTTELDRMVKSWVALTGSGTKLYYIRRADVSKKTTLDNSNPYWIAMRDALKDMDIKVLPVVCPATSDMLVIRNLGIPAVGFSPKFRTPNRIHKKDEYLNAKTFLRGIDVYYEIMKKLGSVPDFETE